MAKEQLLLAPRTEAQRQERDDRVNEFLTRGVDAIYPNHDALKSALLSGKRLNAYMGIDPTAPDLHIGHVSQLQKLSRLQGLGHNVTLLIGDYTAMIGDPTDKSSARKVLTREEVLQNAQTYRDQASKILNFDDPNNPINLRYNSEWLGRADGLAEILQVAAQVSVQQMSERDMFERRMKDGKPVYLNEFMYPLLQGYDSVAMDVDIEIGGSDQIFNMMIGRDFVRKKLGKDKFVVGGSLLVDPGGKKIGKSEENMVSVTDSPAQMFDKIMKLGDQIVPHALELCTELPMKSVKDIEAAIKSGELDPVDAKKFLARVIVSDLHSPEQAKLAESEYAKTSTMSSPESIQELHVASGSSIVDILVASGLAQSKNGARRLIAQNGVRINGETITDPNYETTGGDLQVGKKTTDSYRKIVLD